MPRIIVTADPVSSRVDEDTPILLNEEVYPVHLSTGHAASQRLERLAWAIADAEGVDRANPLRTSAAARTDLALSA